MQRPEHVFLKSTGTTSLNGVLRTVLPPQEHELKVSKSFMMPVRPMKSRLAFSRNAWCSSKAQQKLSRYRCILEQSALTVQWRESRSCPLAEKAISLNGGDSSLHTR